LNWTKLTSYSVEVSPGLTEGETGVWGKQHQGKGERKVIQTIMDPRLSLSLEELKGNARQVFDLLDVSSSTRQDYAYRIGLFLEFIAEKGFNRNSFLEFKRYLQTRSDLAIATKNKYLAAARVFLRELFRNRVIPVDITSNVRSFRQSNHHRKEGLNQREIDKLVAKIKRLGNSPKDARLKALFCLLALQGLRQIEIVRLNVEDLDLVNGRAFIQGKGQDDKELIYLHPETVAALRNYLKVTKVKSGAVFTSLGNRASKRLTTKTIQNEFEVLFKKLRIKKTVHGFRHFYITHLLKNFPMHTVRKYSRHKCLQMLVVYDDELNLAQQKDEVFGCFQISIV